MAFGGYIEMSLVDLVFWVVVPSGVVTVIVLGSEGSADTSMRYPTGRKVLNPCMRYGFPWKRRETRWMTPGVSMLLEVSKRRDKRTSDARLALKVLHDIQKLIVDVWVVCKLILDSVEIAKGVGDVEGTRAVLCVLCLWSGCSIVGVHVNDGACRGNCVEE